MVHSGVEARLWICGCVCSKKKKLATSLLAMGEQIGKTTGFTIGLSKLNTQKGPAVSDLTGQSTRKVKRLFEITSYCQEKVEQNE